MHVLVTGTGGLLGSNVATMAESAGETVTATYHNREPTIRGDCEELDITNTEQISNVLAGYDPDVLVNCAAMTDVDECEHNPEKAQRVNGDAPGELARLADNHNIKLVQISTNYVFDGRKQERYEPDDETGPIQVYGRSKFRGERQVNKNHPNPLIVRPSFVYGRNETNELLGFPAWVLSRIQGGVSTPLFTDQYVTPTRAGSAAKTILELCRRDATGTFHSAATNCVTPYEFGTTLAEITGESITTLKRGRLSDVDRPAKRPRYTCLSVAETEQQLERSEPTLREDIAALF